MKFKGPAFPSYFQAPTEGKKVKVWNPHQGRGQRLRLLRQKCRVILNEKDVETAMMGQRLVSVVQGQRVLKPETDVEMSIMMLMAAGIDLAAQKQVPWRFAMAEILDGAALTQAKVRMRVVEDGDGESRGEVPAGEQGGPGETEGGSREGEERLHDVQRDPS